MARTTLDIETPIMEEIKELQQRERKSMGRVVSELLAEALSQRSKEQSAPTSFAWESQPMSARVELADKEAVWALLDQSSSEEH
ncbi:MAG: hypothetical protein JW797_02580 [Bradymonadales bacterium]|nr:hypothetical protein [Bradymonadales bacterium]